MATSLDQAENIWEAETQNSGSDWKNAVDESSGPCEGLMKIDGVNACNIDNAWKKGEDGKHGVDSVSATDFDNSVEGKGSKWKKKFKQGVANNG